MRSSKAPAGTPPSGDSPDAVVTQLAQLFAAHPAWQEAAARVSERSSSNVYFRQRPGEVWRLVRRAGRSCLEPGAAKDPDFVFRFAPGSVRRLASVSGGVDDFAVALFSLFDEVDELRVDFRVVAPLRRLVARGYLKLLLKAGPKLAAYGASKGLHGLRDLRGLVARSRARTPFEWESESPP